MFVLHDTQTDYCWRVIFLFLSATAYTPLSPFEISYCLSFFLKELEQNQILVHIHVLLFLISARSTKQPSVGSVPGERQFQEHLNIAL